MRLLFSLSLLYIVIYISLGLTIFILSGGAASRRWYLNEILLITIIGSCYFISSYILFLLSRKSFSMVVAIILHALAAILLLLPGGHLPILNVTTKIGLFLFSSIIYIFLFKMPQINKNMRLLIFMYMGSFFYIGFTGFAAKTIGIYLAMPTNYFYGLSIIALIHIMLMHRLINAGGGTKA
jgi:hypothetical protein